MASESVPIAETDVQKSRIWGAFWEAKSRQNQQKTITIFDTFFERTFWGIRSHFGGILPLLSSGFSGTCSNMRFSRFLKDVPCVWHTFPGPGPPRIDKNRQKNIIKFRTRFLSAFWSIWPPFWPPLCNRLATEGLPKTCPKSDLGKGPQDRKRFFSYARIPVAPLLPIMSEYTKKIDPKVAFRHL